MIVILCEFERNIAHFLQFWYLLIAGLTLTNKLVRLTVFLFFYFGFLFEKACSLEKLICMQIWWLSATTLVPIQQQHAHKPSDEIGCGWVCLFGWLVLAWIAGSLSDLFVFLQSLWLSEEPVQLNSSIIC